MTSIHTEAIWAWAQNSRKPYGMGCCAYLTAGHDVAHLEAAIVIDVAQEWDEITQMSANQKKVPAGDMLMKDGKGLRKHRSSRNWI